MILHNFLQKFKNQNEHHKINLGIKIVELARELNCEYYSNEDCSGINHYFKSDSGYIMWFSKQVEQCTLEAKIMKQSYCLIGYVKDGEFVIWIKNIFGGERFETKALFEIFEYFKENFIDGINHYKIIQEKNKLKALQEDFV